MIGTLNRPRLLVQAARFGVDEYARATALPSLLKVVGLPKSGEAIIRLMEIEADMNDARRSQVSIYSVSRHVEILIALMGEARLLRAQLRPADA